MSFGNYDQESLLSIIAYDDSPGGSKTAVGLLPAESFDTVYRKIFERLQRFVHRFNTAPGENFFDLIQDQIKVEPDSKDIYSAIYSSIKETWDGGINREFVFSRAVLFGRHSRLRRGIGEAIEHLNTITEESVANAELALDEARKASYGIMDLGVHTHDLEGFLKGLRETEPPAFLTGIPELDKYNLGPARGELWMLAALYGRGKTWGLWSLAMAACLLSRATVLYVPLEMTQEKACLRFAQMMTGYGKRNETVPLTRFIKNEEGGVLDFDFDKVEVPGLYDEGAYEQVVKRMSGLKRRARIRVKAWPSGELTMPLLEAYLDALHGFENEVPDLVIIDYLTICKIEKPENKRVELGQYAVKFRGLAAKRNCAVATAVQLNKMGMGTNRATGREVGEDFSSTATADKFLIYNQSELEAKLGLARLLVDKDRDDKGNFEVLISQNYAAGKFVVDSAMMNMNYETVLERNER